jgi:putative phosphoribosyl transferase
MIKEISAPQVIFENRHDAGRQLADELYRYSGQSVVVLAIPNGGVPVALEVASALQAEFDLVISRKMTIPTTYDGALGAIADDGTMILNEAAVERIGLSEQQIEDEASKVRAEIKQRSLLYKGERPLVIISGKTVIIVDDGMASGITMVAAVESVRHRRPKEIIAAVPIAPTLALKQAGRVADKVVACVSALTPRFHAADYFQYWQDLSDADVIRYLNEWHT